ncbi:MAG: ketopantoate reductase family protein [Candidatus Gastranaerophilales bacterium]|nr:ketopantoate reductase family protein [Candidatus Gastranaerophilales bacterium]
MKEIKNVLILGLGAIGSIYATTLYDFDSDCVKILIDEPRYKKYKKNGIIFNQHRYDFDYILDTDTNFKADLILIATKSTDFDKASDMIRNFVADDTIILSLLNGISCEEILFQKYGREKVLYSYFLGHSSMKSDVNIDFDGVGTVFFGEECNKEYSQNVLTVKEFFDKVGIDYKIPEDMLSALWQKFIINIGANQTLAILKMSYGAFNNRYAKTIANDLMCEALEIAKFLGINNYENFIENAFKILTTIPPELKPSMLQDVENGKPTEVDIFAGEVCRLGKKYNIPTPKNELVLNILKTIDEKTLRSNRQEISV